MFLTSEAHCYPATSTLAQRTDPAVNTLFTYSAHIFLMQKPTCREVPWFWDDSHGLTETQDWGAWAAQSCPTLCDPMDCSLPGSSVHAIVQAWILQGVAVPFSRGSSRPKDRTQVSHTACRFFTVWATRESQTRDCLTLKPPSAIPVSSMQIMHTRNNSGNAYWSI